MSNSSIHADNLEFSQDVYEDILKTILFEREIKAEAKPYKRGYYTGAFDMFHYGHLRGIQNALKYCEQLIVAVSTDEVIKDYKHCPPIIPFEQRLAIVSAIKGVTIAIPQSDLYDKMGPAEALDCDVIFSSEEYLRSSYNGIQMTDKQRAGVERWEVFEVDAKNNGIDVVYLPRTQNISSTEIKERIIEQNLDSKQDASIHHEETFYDTSLEQQLCTCLDYNPLTENDNLSFNPNLLSLQANQQSFVTDNLQLDEQEL